MKPPGQFDHDYAKAIQDACIKAIIEASVDPATNTAVLRNSEITKALLRIMAMLAATSDEASSPTKIRHLAEDFAKEFRQLVTANKASMDENGGPPFPVLHQGDLQ
jgi:Pyruvate/2-oxoacid:ferredoxin oxidoreductase gamma subunit